MVSEGANYARGVGVGLGRRFTLCAGADYQVVAML